ncbi:MAG: quinone oxidoreductase family protein [Hyphomicrobium sp.]
MVFAIRVHSHGGPEVLKWKPIDIPSPRAGEVRIRQRAVGVNYIDVYQRAGLYNLSSFPAILGMEGAGEIISLGEGVKNFKIGDRVAYGTEIGGYAQERIISADRLVPLPKEISFENASAIMLRGMTVRYLFCETFPVSSQTVMLFHAVAGGVGLLACQWARSLGATIIGTVGSSAKAQIALEHGCTHVIEYRRENFVDRVRDITKGIGCDVVYDSVGRETFSQSLDCLKPKGLMVSFGNSSGAVPPFNLTALKGSLFITRPSLMEYTKSQQQLSANAADVFKKVADGTLKITINQRYALCDAAQAHNDLETRKTTGSTILIP